MNRHENRIEQKKVNAKAKQKMVNMDSKLKRAGVTGYNKRMNRIACVYVFMFFCAIWWIDGILG